MHIWPILTSPPLPFFPNFVFSIVTLPSTFAHLSEMVNLVSIPLPGSSRRREQHVHLKPFPSSPNPLIPMVGMQMHGRPWKPTRERTTADRLLSADRGAPAGRAHSSNNRRGSSFEPPPLRAAKGRNPPPIAIGDTPRSQLFGAPCQLPCRPCAPARGGVTPTATRARVSRRRPTTSGRGARCAAPRGRAQQAEALDNAGGA
jgi:hypothetical protein